jgi:hypothetical protein
MRKSHLAGEVMGACRKAEEGKKPMVITISEARSFMVAFVLEMTISSLFVSQQKSHCHGFTNIGHTTWPGQAGAAGIPQGPRHEKMSIFPASKGGFWHEVASY